MPEQPDHQLRVSSDALSKYMADLDEQIRIAGQISPWGELEHISVPPLEDLADKHRDRMRESHDGTVRALASTVEETGQHHTAYHGSDEDNAESIRGAI